jgi:hypothetical protein
MQSQEFIKSFSKALSIRQTHEITTSTRSEIFHKKGKAKHSSFEAALHDSNTMVFEKKRAVAPPLFLKSAFQRRAKHKKKDSLKISSCCQTETPTTTLSAINS